MSSLTEKYPHLLFQKQWSITERSWFELGQCVSYIKSICGAPTLPQYSKQLHHVSLVKGAQATTAIEGNTMTEEEIEGVIEGQKNMPESRAYQQVEVENVIQAFEELFREVVPGDTSVIVTPDFIKRLHKMIGKNLGDSFGAIAGRLRENNVSVGRYLAPDSSDVPQLVESMCKWLREEFKFESGNQRLSDVIIQAIVAHVYLEWIHPFGDGNGRTGRLLEFYILLRGGVPTIALHLLSNHYNLTRPEYYKQIADAQKKGDLSDFIQYALIGFKDGLHNTLTAIQHSEFIITWQKHIYDKFAEIRIVNKEVFKRKRTMILGIPIGLEFSIEELPLLTPSIAKYYANLSKKSIYRDIMDLLSMELLIKIGTNKYTTNATILNGFISARKNIKF